MKLSGWEKKPNTCSQGAAWKQNVDWKPGLQSRLINTCGFIPLWGRKRGCAGTSSCWWSWCLRGYSPCDTNHIPLLYWVLKGLFSNLCMPKESWLKTIKGDKNLPQNLFSPKIQEFRNQKHCYFPQETAVPFHSCFKTLRESIVRPGMFSLGTAMLLLRQRSTADNGWSLFQLYSMLLPVRRSS